MILFIFQNRIVRDFICHMKFGQVEINKIIFNKQMVEWVGNIWNECIIGRDIDKVE